MTRKYTTPRRWSPADRQHLREHIGKQSHAEIAAHLGRVAGAVKCAAVRFGFVTRRHFTADEIALVREHAGKLTWVDIARRLNRPITSIYNLTFRLGLTKAYVELGEPFEQYLREQHALGWSDAEIAAGWGCERHTVGDWRKRLGLPHNTLSEHRRQRVREKTAEQLRKAGLKSIGMLRVVAFRERARQAGWPEDLRPRAVQMLNALWEHGPMTRRQLADAIGMPWKGSRKSLVSNDPQGTYLKALIDRGLVVTLGRLGKVTGQGKGKSVQVYSLPLTIERQVAS